MSSSSSKRPFAFMAGQMTGKALRDAKKGIGKGVKKGAKEFAKAVRASAEKQAQDPDMARWYANLEIPYGSDLDEVNRARKRMMARYHPDRYANDPEAADRANELVLALNQAHAELVKRLTQ